MITNLHSNQLKAAAATVTEMATMTAMTTIINSLSDKSVLAGEKLVAMYSFST
jgi:hypothetical protein